MARPLRITFPGAFYHVTSRGNERKSIFKSNRDREKFLEYFESATLRYDAKIHSYCLMENHYHILIETPSGNISQIMHHINGAYTTYFNVKRDRSGHLFQGRYKGILIDADEYAKELSRYIHLNPVRAKIVEKPEEYKWSSFQDYIGERKPSEWLKREFILGYFGTRPLRAEKMYGFFVNSLLGKKYESPLKDTIASTILGCNDFIRDVKETYINVNEISHDVPALKEFAGEASMEDIFKAVDIECSGERISRDVKLYLSQRYTGEGLRKIGEQFGISGSAVSHASRRISGITAKDKKSRKKINSIIKSLKLSTFKT